MDKVIRNGKVAVLHTNSWGSTWYDPDFPECLFDPGVIAWVEGGKVGDRPKMLCEKNDGNGFYSWSENNLTISWVEQGKKFRVEDYDGYEYIITEDDLKLTA